MDTDLAFVHYCKTELGYSFDRQEWIADMSMDCDYDLTVSCVQLDLVDSPGADTEDQETVSRLQRGSTTAPPATTPPTPGCRLGCRGSLNTHTGFIIYRFN